MIATSPDGQWALIRRGREISLLAVADGQVTARIELDSAEADLTFVGPPVVLAVVDRPSGGPSGGPPGGPPGEPSHITLYLPPYLDAVARIQLTGALRIAAQTGPRLVLVSLDGRAVTIVRIAGRALSAQPIETGSPVELAVGLERNQVLFSLLRKLEVWDAAICRPLLRMQLQLPPPPRIAGPALGHLWATRRGSGEILVCRLSDGRPFHHRIDAPIDDVIYHAASPLLMLVTPRGLVRLHCFAHALTPIEAPWRPGVSLAQLVVGDDISLLGMADDEAEPWRLPIGGAGAPPIALESIDVPGRMVLPAGRAAATSVEPAVRAERASSLDGTAGDAAPRDPLESAEHVSSSSEPSGPVAPRRDASLAASRISLARASFTEAALRTGSGVFALPVAESAAGSTASASAAAPTAAIGAGERSLAASRISLARASYADNVLRSDTTSPAITPIAALGAAIDPTIDAPTTVDPIADIDSAVANSVAPAVNPTDIGFEIAATTVDSFDISPAAIASTRVAPAAIAATADRSIASTDAPIASHSNPTARISLISDNHAAAPSAPLAAMQTAATDAKRAMTASWRQPLVAFASQLIGAGEPTGSAIADVPAVPGDSELGQLASRLQLPEAAHRALIILYSLYLVGAPVSIARLATLLGDWTEPLGRGELTALAMLRRRGGRVRLRGAVSDALDGAPPRAIRLIGDAATAACSGLARFDRDRRTDAAIEAELAGQLGRLAVVEGPAARAVLEAYLHDATAVALIAPPARPLPWPRDAGLIIVADPASPAWIASLPSW